MSDPSARRPLSGRRALLTGASRGIGLATARALAGAGARVACVARDAARLEAAVQGIGEGALAFPADLTRSADTARMWDAVGRALGDFPDILVNNAGIFSLAPVGEGSVEEFERTVAGNLVAPYRCISIFLRKMSDRRGPGHVVTVGSVADRHVFPGNAAYSASKFGARALHEALRLELRGTGVRATLVSPGPVDTPMWDPIDPDSRPDLTPRSAMLSADDVADAILWAVTRPAHVNVDELRLSRR